MLKALAAAGKVARYRHARLSADPGCGSVIADVPAALKRPETDATEAVLEAALSLHDPKQSFGSSASGQVRNIR
jgi:hypothetical protein